MDSVTNKLAGDYGIEVSNEESKVMFRGIDNITVDITMNGQKWEQVDAFKCIGSRMDVRIKRSKSIYPSQQQQ